MEAVSRKLEAVSRARDREGAGQTEGADLVSPADEVEIGPGEELGDHILAEGEADPAVALAPPSDVLFRVGPEQVAQQAWHRSTLVIRAPRHNGATMTQ